MCPAVVQEYLALLHCALETTYEIQCPFVSEEHERTLQALCDSLREQYITFTDKVVCGDHCPVSEHTALTRY